LLEFRVRHRQGVVGFVVERRRTRSRFGRDRGLEVACSDFVGVPSEPGGIIGFVFVLRLRGLRSFGHRSGQASLGRGPTFGQLFLIGDDRDRTGGQVTVE
jgi:hypothetical protein